MDHVCASDLTIYAANIGKLFQLWSKVVVAYANDKWAVMMTNGQLIIV